MVMLAACDCLFAQNSPNYPEPLIMMPVLQGYPQDDFVFIHETGEYKYISFYQFAHIAGLNITKNDGSRLEGFAGDKNNAFLIDFGRKKASFNKKEIFLAGKDAAQIDGQISFRTEFLENLFSVKITLDKLSMVLDIEADYKLPKTIREDALLKREKNAAYTPQKDLWADYEFDGRAWALPVLDLSFTTGLSSRQYADGAGRKTDDWQNYGVNVAALTAGLDSNLYLFGGSGNDFIPRARFATGRIFLRDEYKFPNLTVFKAGDIIGTGSSYFESNTSGRGITLSSFKNYVISADKTITLSGFLQDGWDVELYLNSQLLGFRRPSVRGQYEFENVPVNYGLNVFKLVFYGPHGEIRGEERRYYSGTSPVKKGEIGYTLDAYQPQRYLMEDNEPFVSKSDVAVVDTVGFYGVSDRFTAIGGFTNSQDAQDPFKSRQFGMAGGQIILGGASLQYNLMEDLQSGETAHRGEAQGNIYIGDIFSRYEYYGKINSPASYRNGKYLKELFETRLSGIIRPFFNTPYYINFTHTYDRHRNAYDAVNARLSRQFFRYYNISVENLWQSQSDAQNTAANDASLLGQANFGPFGIYTGASYRTYPENFLSDLNAKLDYRWDRKTYFAAQYRRGGRYLRGASYNDVFSLTGSRIFSFGGISAEFSVSTHKNIAAAFTYNISFGPKADSGVFKDAKSKLSDYGSIFVRALDERGTPLENIILNVRGGEKPAQTDKNGEAVITAIAPYEKTILNLDLSEIEDSALFPLSDNYRYILRPGTVRNISLPLARKGAVEGKIYHNLADRYLPGYEIKIYDDKGVEAAETFTDFYGLFILDNLPFGIYSIEISKDGQNTAKIENVNVESLVTYVEADFKVPAPRRISAVEDYDEIVAQENPAPPADKAQNAAGKKIFGDIEYPFNSYQLNAAQEKHIREKAALLKSLSYEKIIITGNTDNIGTYSVNKIISEKRAQAAAKLLAEEGIRPEAMEIKGAAYDTPVADNSTKEGRAKNRRTDIEIL